MASAIASAATRNIPSPYIIPVGPRVRPPRLLPGTKAANTNPQPDERPPIAGHVWVQGKWRNPGSNAAKDRREIQSTRTEKALRHITHGMNIYAYRNMQTNQVVYSLTRVMQNNKILPQLIYHGKKTVPAALRRDVWRPYFSMHFARDPAGARAGLEAYRRLRELSLQRQLSPPKELVTATEEDVERAKQRYNPLELKQRLKEKSVKYLPVENQLLPQKLKARRLMDQKATSVADAAFVLELMNQELSPAEQLRDVEDKRAAKFQHWSSRALRRLDAIRKQETTKASQLEARRNAVQPNEGQLGLTSYAARRIALEHGGSIAAATKGMEYMVRDLGELAVQQEITNEYPANIPPNPLEGQRPVAFNLKTFRSEYIKAWKSQHGDESEGPPAEEIAAKARRESRKSAARFRRYHKQLAAARQNLPQAQNERNNESRKVRILWADVRDLTWAENWSSNVQHGELESRAALRQSITVQQKDAIDQDGNRISEEPSKIEFQASTTPHVFGNSVYSGWYQTPEQMERKSRHKRSQEMNEWTPTKLERSREIFVEIADIQDSSKLQEMEANYPSIYEKVKVFGDWRDKLADYANFLRIKDQMPELRSMQNTEDLTISKQLRGAGLKLIPYAKKFPDQLPETSKLQTLVTEGDRESVWRGLDGYIEGVLQHLESDEQFMNTSIIDLVRQRVEAEKHEDAEGQSNQESLASIDAEIKAIEDRLIDQLVGIESAEPLEPMTEAREKGIEQPAPKKRGIFARLFGKQ